MFEYYLTNILFGILKVALTLAPVLLAYIAYHMWHHYVNEDFVAGIQWQLLEIQIPRVVNKTPLAMETVIVNSFYHKSNKGVWESYWQGAVHFFFSLEIVSTEGQVHFYINTPSRVVPLIKSQIYAQYPQCRILEVPDYVFDIPKIGHKTGMNMWGCEWKLEKDDAYPIRTYVGYGLDKIEKDPTSQVDPIVSIIEFMATAGPQEHFWMQLVIRWSKKKYPGGMDFTEHSQSVADELLAPYTKKQFGKVNGVEDMNIILSKEIRTPDTLKDEVTSINEKLHKLCFDCGMRTLYIAPHEIFDQQKRRALRMIFRQFNSLTFNSFLRIHPTQYDSIWEDPFGIVLTNRKNRMLDWYRFRTFFHPPFQYSVTYPWPISLMIVTDPPEIFVLNSEEIATVFHFPGLITETPSMKRADNRTAKAPANLPM